MNLKSKPHSIKYIFILSWNACAVPSENHSLTRFHVLRFCQYLYKFSTQKIWRLLSYIRSKWMLFKTKILIFSLKLLSNDIVVFEFLLVRFFFVVETFFLNMVNKITDLIVGYTVCISIYQISLWPYFSHAEI